MVKCMDRGHERLEKTIIEKEKEELGASTKKTNRIKYRQKMRNDQNRSRKNDSKPIK